MPQAIKDLAPGAGNYGIIAYGPYQFAVLRKADFSAVVVYDEADRSATHLKYTLRISDAVIWGADQNSQNLNMATMQGILSQPGLELIIDAIGFDTHLDTSRSGTRPDMIWGAKPRAFNFRPTGGELSWQFDWECEFNVSRCAVPSALGAAVPPLMAWNYEWTSAVNVEGLMQRVISGYVQVPAVRGDNPNQNKVLFDVVAAWDQITINVPDGFRRTENVHSVNKAKNRVDFSVTDTELTSDAYPAGIVECEMDYDISSAVGLAQWTATLSGTLTVAPGYPKSLAAVKFLAIVAFFVPKIKTIAITSDQKQPAVIPVNMRLGHRLFTRTSRFSVTYMFAATADSLLQKSGIWDAVPGTDYQQWATSMKVAGVWDNHGTSGVKSAPGDDSLVTVCVSIASTTLQSSSLHKYDGSTTPDLQVSTLQAGAGTGYLAYQNAVVPLMRRDAVIHKFAQQYSPGDKGYEDHIVQDRAAPDQFVRMVGYAVRLNAAPEMPQLDKVGTKSVELLRQGGGQDDEPVSEAFGNRIYRARWDNLYRIAGQPSPPPSEPGAMPVASQLSTLPLTGGTIMESTIRAAGEEEQS